MKIVLNAGDIIIYETNKLLITIIYCEDFYAKFICYKIDRKLIEISYLDYPKEKSYNSQNRGLDYQ